MTSFNPQSHKPKITMTNLSSLAFSEELSTEEKRIFWQATLATTSALGGSTTANEIVDNCKLKIVHFKAMAYAALAYKEGTSLSDIENCAIGALDRLKGIK